MKNTEQLRQKIEEAVHQLLAADPDHFLVEVKLLPNNKVQVFADADSGITINKCAEINLALQKILEKEKWLGNDYEIEVSSPGLDAPLRVIRQFQRRLGRQVEVWLHNGNKYEGALIEANEQQIKLGIEKKINKKETTSETITVPFSEIKTTKLKLNFKI
jgi:ribosome maturation factor RimP